MAHIPDGFLSVPVMAGTATVSLAALATAARRTRAALGEREGPVLGAVTAFVFAAQMLNFPLGIGASAHLLGGALVAVLLGPWAGMLVLFAVLLVQALLFQDGGIAALGANTLNVAVLGVGSATLIFRIGQAVLGETRRATVVAAGLAAWISTGVVGMAVAAELVLSGLVPLRPAVLLVGGGHALIGVAEAVLTGMLVGFVFRTRPELLASRTSATPGVRVRVVALTGVALAVLLVAAGLASSQPDALTAMLERLGAPVGTAVVATPFADYTSPVGGIWVAGAVGLLAAFLVTWGFAIALVRRRP